MAFQATATDESDRNSSVPRVIAALAAGGRADAAFGLAERRRARELGRRLYEASALELSPAPVVSRPVTASSLGAARIAALLPDDSTALVEYVTGALGAPTTAFVVTRRGGLAPARILAPADSLTGAIARLIALLAKGEAAPAEARSLAVALLDPALAELDSGVTRLIIVPDGPLHRIPWDALRLDDGRFVVERYAIAIAPSAETLALLWGRPAPPRGPARLLAFGDPHLRRRHLRPLCGRGRTAAARRIRPGGPTRRPLRLGRRRPAARGGERRVPAPRRRSTPSP